MYLNKTVSHAKKGNIYYDFGKIWFIRPLERYLKRHPLKVEKIKFIEDPSTKNKQ